LAAADVVVGYQTYLDLISDLLHGKEVMGSQMMKEVERCSTALALALEGHRVALVCGGDPGIYAMAGLVLELGRNLGRLPELEVIPGIAAVNACAARLGAPLMHDFAAISLSDLLTPWETIEKRLHAAASADFVIVLYNPKSKRRTWQIERAASILLGHRDPFTPVGIVTNATRKDERITITTLERMASFEITMQSCVIIGNSMTFAWEGWMVTPRGYGEKYDLGGRDG